MLSHAFQQHARTHYNESNALKYFVIIDGRLDNWNATLEALCLRERLVLAMLAAVLAMMASRLLLRRLHRFHGSWHRRCSRLEPPHERRDHHDAPASEPQTNPGQDGATFDSKRATMNNRRATRMHTRTDTCVK